MTWHWQVRSDSILPAAKQGARGLGLAFIILRLLLAFTAIIAIVRVTTQGAEKHWFENHLLAVTYLERSYAEMKWAKSKLYDYALGAPSDRLNRALTSTEASAHWLKETRNYIADDDRETLAYVEQTEKALQSGLLIGVNSVIDSQKQHGDETTRNTLTKKLIDMDDSVSLSLFNAYKKQVGDLVRTAGRFKDELRDSGLGPIFLLLSTYILLLGGLTRAYLKERRRNEEVLRASEAEVQVLLDNMHDGLVILDEDGKIEACNEKLLQMVGAEQGDLLKSDVSSLFVTAINDRIESIRGSAFSIIEEATACRNLDGSSFPVEISLRSVETVSGDRVLVTMRDITEKKRAQQWKRDMVAVVSHDLRTPLTSIQGSLDLIETGALGALPVDLSGLLFGARSNSHRLISIINILLDLEKLESSDEPLDLNATALDTAVKVAIENNEAAAADKSIQVIVDSDLPQVMGEGLRLSQLVEHLLNNAIKFSANGSEIHICASLVGDWLELRVKDQGRGIPVEFQEVIFQRLEQVDPEDRKSGAGLGLAFCKAIANKHGGAIGVDSRVGSGSEFWVLLKPAPSVQTTEDAAGVILSPDMVVAQT